MIENVKTLSKAEHEARNIALKSILDDYSLPYILQTGTMNDKYTENIIIRMGEGEKRIVIGAHYDSVEKSTGANDNATGVCIIIELAKMLQSHSPAPDIDFVFFDYEETGGLGSRLYIKEVGAKNIAYMLNFDICGVGDVILAAPQKLADTSPFSEAFSMPNMKRHIYEMLPGLPPGDDRIFSEAGVKSFSFAIVDRGDVSSMRILFGQGGKVPKEDFPSIIDTMHNGPLDCFETVDEKAMAKLKDFAEDLLGNLMSLDI